jgi:uncharacterized protein (TIGR02268 family)
LLQPSASPLALASLLLSLTTTAAQGFTSKRSVVLTGMVGDAPVLYVAPGTETFLVLDAPIERESVEVEGRARFARVDPGDQGITLVLQTPLRPGERLELRFTYREGLPRSAVLWLTSQPGLVDEVVNVRRPPQAMEACHVELAATRERCEAQRKELEELKARLPVPSPAAMALSGFVNFRGMKGQEFREPCRGEAHSGLRSEECWGLGAVAWSVVVVVVSNTGTEPWVPAWAEVTPEAGGEPRRARAVLTQGASLPPGGTASVAVEVEMPERKEKEEWLSVPHSLRVCDEAGSRCLSASQVEL